MSTTPPLTTKEADDRVADLLEQWQRSKGKPHDQAVIEQRINEIIQLCSTEVQNTAWETTHQTNELRSVQRIYN